LERLSALVIAGPADRPPALVLAGPTDRPPVLVVAGPAERPPALVLAGPADRLGPPALIVPSALVHPLWRPTRMGGPDGTPAIPRRSTAVVSLRGGGTASRSGRQARRVLAMCAARRGIPSLRCAVAPAPAGNSRRGAVAEADRVVDGAVVVLAKMRSVEGRRVRASSHPDGARVRRIPDSASRLVHPIKLQDK
jgi:hypothetical protein